MHVIFFPDVLNGSVSDEANVNNDHIDEQVGKVRSFDSIEKLNG